jgi:hypothetical protein
MAAAEPEGTAEYSVTIASYCHHQTPAVAIVLCQKLEVGEANPVYLPATAACKNQPLTARGIEPRHTGLSTVGSRQAAQGSAASIWY